MEKMASSQMTGKVCLFLDFPLENLLVIFVWLRGAVSFKSTVQAFFNEATQLFEATRRLELWIIDISDYKYFSHETHLVGLNKKLSDCVRNLTETKFLINKVRCLNSEQC